jgi:hypothetical protein
MRRGLPQGQKQKQEGAPKRSTPRALHAQQPRPQQQQQAEHYTTICHNAMHDACRMPAGRGGGGRRRECARGSRLGRA